MSLPAVRLQPAMAGMLAPVAAALAADPAFGRNRRATDGLRRRLVGAAAAAGDDLIVPSVDGAAAGLAWFCRRGGLGTAAYLRFLAVRPPWRGWA